MEIKKQVAHITFSIHEKERGVERNCEPAGGLKKTLIVRGEC